MNDMDINEFWMVLPADLRELIPEEEREKLLNLTLSAARERAESILSNRYELPLPVSALLRQLIFDIALEPLWRRLTDTTPPERISNAAGQALHVLETLNFPAAVERPTLIITSAPSSLSE